MELERLVASSRGRAERLGPQGALRLGELYRMAAADLAVARRRFPSDPFVVRLEDLVGRARALVYQSPGRRASLRSFFARDYWRLVAERPLPLLVAAVLLIGPGLLAGAWSLQDPGAAAGLAPVEYRSVTEPREAGADLGLSVEEQAAFSSAIFTNNIQVTFLAFAGGIAAGLGTALLLAYNGVVLGTVAGLSIEAGNGAALYQLVVAHGVLELSCIVVGGAAGLRLGWALIEPGRWSRRAALLSHTRSSVLVVLGTVPWLVLAGLVEGFLTPAGTGTAAVSTVGVALGVSYWMLVVIRGRLATDELSASPADRLRRRLLRASAGQLR
ncbi:MAG: stage II sporulation protein M [Actinomycetota bacterium]